MKIYFAGSIRGGREDVDLYLKIINHLKNYGEVLTEHIGDKDLKGEEGKSDTFIHNRDMDWLSEANTLVAEVTSPSLGVGYEIGRIVERNLWAPEKYKKNLLCLYRPKEGKELSAMIEGSSKIMNKQYTDFKEAKNIIDKFFENLPK